ncbi:MAG: RagB/SusD family nutrient uptake outer membrane protein [Tenacibaculum sp.]|nr:RagB/SusD family nutrient uptake outer membrane protein [Tenacibaculum sp.]
MFKKLLILTVVSLIFTSCDDYLDVKPVGKIIPTTYEDYRKFITAGYNIPKNDKILSTYRTDELKLSEKSSGVEYYKDIYTWQDNGNSSLSSQFPYGAFYSTIFYANEIINNKDKIEGNSTEINQLVGEAYALRALQYFDLINLYSKPYNKQTASTDKGVPLVTVYDADKEYKRASVEEVYNQILNDCKQAEKLLNIKVQPIGLNYRFSEVAIKTLLANVCMYREEWQKAVAYAKESLAIKSELQDLNTNLTILPSEYNSVESILALSLVSSFDINTNALISDDLSGSYDELNDLRFNNYFRKAKDGLHSKKNADKRFRCTFRTADLYLILAEAQANLGNILNAKKNLLILANKRYNTEGFNNFKSSLNNQNKEQLIISILNERKREFAIEGKRWFDLRRTLQPKLTKIYNGQLYVLEQEDKHYTLPFPKSAKISNPLLEE